MAEDRKISIAIPTYNRSDMTINAFLSVYDDKRVAEIVIVDDESDLGMFNKLKDVCDYLPKVTVPLSIQFGLKVPHEIST